MLILLLTLDCVGSQKLGGKNPIVSQDSSIEHYCPKNMWNIPPKFSDLIYKDKAYGKAMNLFNDKSLDFYKTNALHCEGIFVICR